MTEPVYVISVDPGETTGWAILRKDLLGGWELYGSGETRTGRAPPPGPGKVIAVVAESIPPRGHKNVAQTEAYAAARDLAERKGARFVDVMPGHWKPWAKVRNAKTTGLGTHEKDAYLMALFVVEHILERGA